MYNVYIYYSKKWIFVWCIEFYTGVPKHEENMFREKC